MLNVSMKTMLEAGVHFGHQTSRWNPKMARYIFGERNGIHILDLQKTAKEIKKAYTFMKDKAQAGATFLFVGTKKQAQDILHQEADRAGVPCVYEKWLGGTLTNFATIRRSVERLNELEKWERDGLFKAISKKEVSRLTKEMTRMKKFLGGMRDLRGTPDVMFIIDPVDNMGALLEAKILNIPIVAVCDTNSDPDMVTYPIPGNDDAARSIKLFCAMAADAVLEGRKAAAEASKAQEQQAEAAAAPAAQPAETPAAPAVEAPVQQGAPAAE